MPAVKQGGGYTLTFAKKNQDVKEHLDKLKSEKVVITDYICEAIRFYEKNKNNEYNLNAIDASVIDKMIEDKIKILLGDSFNPKQENELSITSLEDNLEGVDDDDLGDD